MPVRPGRDPAEKSRAWERYRVIRDFAQSSRCQHRQISQHFGETPRWNSCESCDVCGYRPVWMQGQAVKKAKGQIPHGLKPIRNDRSRARAVLELQPLPDADHELREYLREWRRTTARAHNIPAFVVMHDTSLEELCRVKPKSVVELRNTYGFGEKKVALYGKEIIEVLNRFGAGARAKERMVAGQS